MGLIPALYGSGLGGGGGRRGEEEEEGGRRDYTATVLIILDMDHTTVMPDRLWI